MTRCPGVVYFEDGTCLPWPVFHDHDVECISDEAREFVEQIWAKRNQPGRPGRDVTPPLTPDARHIESSRGTDGHE